MLAATLVETTGIDKSPVGHVVALHRYAADRPADHHRGRDIRVPQAPRCGGGLDKLEL
jgi:hypothetical protein